MKRIPRQVAVLGIVSFFADISSEMIYPILPLYLTESLQAPATVLGVIEGAAAVVVGILAVASGWLSDRSLSRARYVQWGYGLPVFGKGLIWLASSWQIVLLGRVLDRTGKGIRGTARDALLADAVSKEDLGRAFGFHRACDTSGAFIGVLVAAGLLYAAEAGGPAPYRLIILIGTASAGLSFLSSLLVRDTRATEISMKRSEATYEKRKPLPRSFWFLIAAFAIFGIANSSDAFILLRAKEIGFSPLNVILGYALYNFIYAAVSYPAGILGDRIGRRAVVTFGWLVYAIVYLAFAVANSAALAWVIFALYGVYMALTDGVAKALLSAEVPPDRRGTAIGIFYGVSAAAMLVGNLVAGLSWDALSGRAPFFVGALAALLAIVVLRYGEQQPRQAEKTF